jgi:rfaE bifunctional protein kinase chain/domain
MHILESSRLAGLLDGVRNVRVAVLGDFCLDAYLMLDSSRAEMSIETGLETRAVREQRYSPGGAGNVAANCAAFGTGTVCALGVVGADLYGFEMRKVLEALRVDTSGLLVQDHDWSTAVYTKMIREGEELNRIDFGNYNALDPATGTALLRRLEALLPRLDCVIINQQLRWGIHTDRFRRELVELVRRHPGKPFVTDSRNYNAEFDGTIRKLNDREAAALCGIQVASGDVSLDASRDAAVELARRWSRPVVVTRGEHGCVVVDGGEVHEVPGVLILSRVDTVGAGDSVLAGFAAALGAGERPAAAAELGNYVAAVTVTKLHVTGTATREEILAVGADPDFRYRPELAREPLRARRLPRTDIEVVDFAPGGRHITHAIFDHDGTISTLRQGWESIMEPMMVKAVLGDSLEKASVATLDAVRLAVRSYIDRTTGVQTLVQMKGLIDIVRDFGFVPAEKILDEHGYKAVYNTELLAMVRERVALLGRGVLDVTDFTLKGAPSFLELLAGRGVKLWLASGTDQADALAEAEALGYARLFEGRIFGAVGDIGKEPKRIVLGKILEEIGVDGATGVVTFGDGPVELRETVKRGGLAVGVASDEVRRWGWNVRKRQRLIEAGAVLVVADFAEGAKLLEVLGVGRS